MRELQQIVKLWRESQEGGGTCVLATVVKTQGSSYRLPGARMLLNATGQAAGSISGGCLEGELLKKAWWLTESGPVIRRYDTTADGDIGTPFGLGCNGIIHVLLERLTPGMETVVDTITNVHQQRRAATICHLLPAAGVALPVMERLTITADGRQQSAIGNRDLAQALDEFVHSSSRASESTLFALDGREVFVETVVPPVRLLVFGAGNDAIPLVEMAGYLGWRTEVFDGRAHFARPERFPTADRVQVRGQGEPLSAIRMDPWTVAVLMTHSYSQDLEILPQLSAAPPRYIGLLGPRKRSLQLMAEAGLHPDQLEASLHAPMGLDIGADGPEQVALAVMAEIQAVLNHRPGGSLRTRLGTIHSRDDETEAPFITGSIACA